MLIPSCTPSVQFALCFATLWLASITSVTNAQSATLTFDEIPFQSVNGLSHAGVNFSFTIDDVDSTEAFYNSFGPGSLTYVTDPSLTGDSTGVLGIEFETPTDIFEFGLAVNSATALRSAASVDLFESDSTTFTTSFIDVSPTTGVLGFSENRFTYSGNPISKAVVRFQHQPGSFALDNLTYTVPEPDTAMQFLTAGVLLSILGWRRRRIAS